ASKPFGVVEAVKTVSDLYSPISGEVVAGKDELAANPALVNQEPYGEGWVIRLQPRDAGGVRKLLSKPDHEKRPEEHHPRASSVSRPTKSDACCTRSASAASKTCWPPCRSRRG